MIEVLIWVVAVMIGLWALHRLALWAEARGWIYYMRRKASPGTRASAFLEVQSLLDPASKHVIESRLEDRSEEDESGEPPRRPGEAPEDG